jgi:hypothetical protein
MFPQIIHHHKQLKLITMKKSVSTIICVLVVMYCFCQSSKHQMSKEDYLRKSKNQKTAAWIMALGGSTALIVGSAMAADDFGDGWNNFLNPNPVPDHDNSDLAAALAISGAAAIVGSIPLFIASGRNKRIAYSLSFKSEKVTALKHGNIAFQKMPAVSFKVKF